MEPTQHLIQFDDTTPATLAATDPLAYFGGADVSRTPTEIDRLQGELAAVHERLAKVERSRASLRRKKRNLDQRAASLSFQIQSLKNNPLAIGRYQSSVPQQYRGGLWENEPISTLRLESIAGLGTSRLRILYERCPTIGDLEVFRVFEGLETLPGIRRITAARVERRLLRWLRSHAGGYVPKASREHIGRGRQYFPKRIDA